MAIRPCFIAIEHCSIAIEQCSAAREHCPMAIEHRPYGYRTLLFAITNCSTAIERCSMVTEQRYVGMKQCKPPCPITPPTCIGEDHRRRVEVRGFRVLLQVAILDVRR